LFTVQYNNVGKNAVDAGISGIGAAMYPDAGISLELGDKYSGFTYTYSHQLSKTVDFNINYMSLRALGYGGSDNECTAYLEWTF